MSAKHLSQLSEISAKSTMKYVGDSKSYCVVVEVLVPDVFHILDTENSAALRDSALPVLAKKFEAEAMITLRQMLKQGQIRVVVRENPETDTK